MLTYDKTACKSVDDVCENLEFCLIHNPARIRVYDNDRKETDQ